MNRTFSGPTPSAWPEVGRVSIASWSSTILTGISPTLNFDRDPAFVKQKIGATNNPDNPDLKGFPRHGGTLIVYHCSADQMVPANVSVDFWKSVTRRTGQSRTDEFYRLLMIPGIAHCGGSPGADVLFHAEKFHLSPTAIC